MSKKLSPTAIVALKEALGKIYWYKSDLRSFLFQSVKDANVLGGINWDTYKWQIASDVVDRLCTDESHVAILTRLCREVCEMTSFKHLDRLDGGEEKAKRAREAVTHLRTLVETHEKVEDEQDAVAQRQRRESERLAQSGAVRQKLGEIRSRYMSFVVSEDAQQRGFELERIMYDIFELFDLDPRASFRVVGEQIDGAFSLDGTDYLFEAKWQKARCGASDLDTFAAKSSVNSTIRLVYSSPSTLAATRGYVRISEHGPQFLSWTVHILCVSSKSILILYHCSLDYGDMLPKPVRLTCPYIRFCARSPL